MKHIQTRYLWIQERLQMKHFQVLKVGTLVNRANILTKQLSGKDMHKHLKAIRHDFRQGKAKTAKSMIGEG